jgi:hypothetical protein
MTGEVDPTSGAHRWNPYAAGQKRYGAGLSSTATSGKIGAKGMQGYAARDRAKKLTVKPTKPVGNNLQIAATRAALARRYGKPYPGTTPNTGA